jgi:hypothetical protein
MARVLSGCSAVASESRRVISTAGKAVAALAKRPLFDRHPANTIQIIITRSTKGHTAVGGTDGIFGISVMSYGVGIGVIVYLAPL